MIRGMPQRLVKKREAVTVRDDGSLRLAVVSDTHSQPHEATHGHLSALRPDAILHAGDIGDLAVLDDLAKVAPLFAVRGNIDARARALPDVLVLDVVGSAPSPSSLLRILLLHIAVNGPRLRADVARMARSEGASLVVCGHSHVPFIGQEGTGAGRIVFFNPGSVGPRRFHLPIVFGTIDLGPTGVRLAHIDCENGRPWSPPG
jgi:putative phosphoesterase